MVGMGAVVAVGSTGSEEEEQAHEVMASAATANDRRAIRGRVVMSRGIGSGDRIRCH